MPYKLPHTSKCGTGLKADHLTSRWGGGGGEGFAFFEKNKMILIFTKQNKMILINHEQNKIIFDGF